MLADLKSKSFAVRFLDNPAMNLNCRPRRTAAGRPCFDGCLRAAANPDPDRRRLGERQAEGHQFWRPAVVSKELKAQIAALRAEGPMVDGADRLASGLGCPGGLSIALWHRDVIRVRRGPLSRTLGRRVGRVYCLPITPMGCPSNGNQEIGTPIPAMIAVGICSKFLRPKSRGLGHSTDWSRFVIWRSAIAEPVIAPRMMQPAIPAPTAPLRSLAE